MSRLNTPEYLAFPFRIGEDGAEKSRRGDHIREQIEQVLFTDPGERIFRPEFGVGVKALVFEPNISASWQIVKKRILASLADALSGEVDPKSINVDVSGEDEKLLIVVKYTLATIHHTERQEYLIGAVNHG